MEICRKYGHKMLSSTCSVVLLDKYYKLCYKKKNCGKEFANIAPCYHHHDSINVLAEEQLLVVQHIC